MIPKYKPSWPNTRPNWTPSMNESPNYPTSADWRDAPDDPDFEPDIIDIYEDDAGAPEWETDEEARFIARYLALNAS